ncbi:Dabb family protein [Snuella lapsa]|uniref:Stress-response A/B barrel domain-containing protein n=1 Tax=Snuella lapsa TaxID=870481 RepID=A0ABP6YLC8_9FLAO
MGNFRHTVFFWLKNPEDQSDRNAFEASLKKFIDSSIFVKAKHLGIPANTPRDVVDNSYTYCLVVDFLTKEDHDKYQAEPAHKLFIEESSNLWEKVQVYDSKNIW